MSQTALHVTLQVAGMTCAGCAGRVERAAAAVPGVSAASVNLLTRTLHAEYSPPAGPAAIAAGVAGAGYAVAAETTQIEVANMTCAGCAGRVERLLAALPGVTGAAVNLLTRTATVTHLAGVPTRAAMQTVLAAGGYPAVSRQDGAAGAGPDADAASEPRDHHDDDARATRRQALIAAALTLPVLVTEMGGHLVPAFHHAILAAIGQQANWVAQFVLTTLVLAGPGRGFLRHGLPALARGAPDMNALVAIGASAAWGYSAVATFAPGLLPGPARVVYFEAAAVIVMLILTGRWLEARAKGRAGAAIRRLVGLQPATARVLRDGVPVDVPVANLRPGDHLLIRPGERIAADGVVAEGTSWIDRSMLTGEAAPQRTGPGDVATGGTVNGAGVLTLRLTQTGAGTTLARIIRMVTEAQGGKLPVQALVDRITRWFVPAVLALAALTVAAWLLVSGNLPQALVAGVSVLIIACPCAMGLATPTSVLVGTGRGAELGLLFRKGAALQALSDVRLIAFDKTGTLTEGKPRVTDTVIADGFARDDVLRLVAGAEALSEHPLATALIAAAGGTPVAHAADVSVHPGLGLTATVAGRRVAVGSAAMMDVEHVEPGALTVQAVRWAGAGRTVVFAAIDGHVAALFAIADPVRTGTAPALAALRAQGLRIAMISGDAAATARRVAADLGIDTVVAGVLPHGKRDALAALRAQHGSVAFVGDGINDAPALAAADVGIAVGTGTDVAIETADVVLMSGDPRGVADAVALSRAVMRNIRQNLFWAFGYNVALIPVAAGLLVPFGGPMLSPMLAAAAMAASSVIVVGNALRLRHALRRRPRQPPEPDAVDPRAVAA